MNTQTLRPAFSMMTAIFVIVIMASIGAMVVSLSGKMVKTTTAQYQREQAVLLAKSYTEYAIMAVMSNNRSAAGCLKTINGDNVSGGYRVRVQVAYISNNTAQLTGCAATHIFSDAATTANSPLNIIVDVYVNYRDFDSHASTAPFITYHKRTLQKI